MKIFKNVLSALLAVAMTLTLASVGACTEVEFEGDGLPESPLQIGTV